MVSESLPPGWDASWEKIGETSTTAYFVDDDGVVMGLPHVGAHDTGTTARENLDFQKSYFDGSGRDEPLVVVIFLHRTASQDKAARTVYSTYPTQDWVLGFALIGGSMLGRAIGSFFLGLAKTQAPLKLFGSLAEARPWLDSLRRDYRRGR